MIIYYDVIPEPVTGKGKVQQERYESASYLMQIWYKSKTGGFYQYQTNQYDNGENRIAFNNCMEVYDALAQHCDKAELAQLRKFIIMAYCTIKAPEITKASFEELEE